jgi:pimeloyl-ACP methyl ester carboxylesterase
MSPSTHGKPQASTRQKVEFQSGGETCAAWHYPGTNGACVVMAGGMAVPKEPATDAFAEHFQRSGYTVLAFDYRRIGASGGEPRQVVRVRDHLADWDAAIARAATLPTVDDSRLAVWGFSFSGGLVVDVAARHRHLAAAIAQTPLVDGQAATRKAARHQKFGALLRFTGFAMVDGIRGAVGGSRLRVPLAAEPGTVAMLTTPDALDGDRALRRDLHPDWPQEVAAWSALRAGFYQPRRRARRVDCPLLVIVCEDDRSALAAPAIRVANRAPRGELLRLPGGHYEPFLDSHARAVEAQLSFLDRHLGFAGGDSESSLNSPQVVRPV